MEEKYKEIGLMQLRVYARSIGVKSPTVYKRVELIEKIERIQNGIDKPYQSNRGRPILNEVKISNEKSILKIKKEIKDKTITAKTKKELGKKLKEIKAITQEYLRNLNKILSE